MGVDELEEFLRSATILHVGAFPLGGAHPDKRLVVLEGNLAVLAKPGHASEEARLMSRCEAAAWIAARELGCPALVPVTVLRQVPLHDDGTKVEASIQVAAPFFQPAVTAGASPATCGDEDSWRVAVFDAIARNTDRNDSNWGFIGDITGVKLVDHGYAFAEWPGREPSSPFVEHRRGEDIPEEIHAGIEKFVEKADESELRTVLDENDVDRLVERARMLAERGRLEL